MARACERCGQERHAPDCPEMFWPDGKPRGAAPNLPMPPLITDPERRARFKVSNPGGDSPLSREMSAIFSGVTEKMLRDHIESQREKED